MPLEPRRISGNVDASPTLRQRFGTVPELHHEGWKRWPHSLGEEMNLRNDTGVDTRRRKRVAVAPRAFFGGDSID